jgi:hypothetical protein
MESSALSVCLYLYCQTKQKHKCRILSATRFLFKIYKPIGFDLRREHIKEYFNIMNLNFGSNLQTKISTNASF